MLTKESIDPTNVLEVIEEVVRYVVAQMVLQPELATFSGSPDDWKIDGNAVYVRLQRTRARDAEGNPHELWARLFAPNGEFMVPDTETEMLVVFGADTQGIPGAAWCFYGAQLPPKKASQTVARQDVSSAMKVLKSAGGWTFRGGPAGESFLTIDRDTGIVMMSIASGTYVGINKETNAIHLQVSKDGQVKAALVLDEKGLHFTAGGKVVLDLDGDTGTQTMYGTGVCYLSSAHGFIGPIAGAILPLAGAAPPAAVPTGWAVSTAA
jgi:hypothetical protein